MALVCVQHLGSLSRVHILFLSHSVTESLDPMCEVLGSSLAPHSGGKRVSDLLRERQTLGIYAAQVQT